MWLDTESMAASRGRNQRIQRRVMLASLQQASSVLCCTRDVVCEKSRLCPGILRSGAEHYGWRAEVHGYMPAANTNPGFLNDTVAQICHLQQHGWK